VADRTSEQLALGEAIAAVPGEDLASSLQLVVERVPLAVSVEAATLRVREEGSDRLHLLAEVGMPFRDVRRVALEHFSIQHARSVLAVGPAHSLAHALGLSWLHGEWLKLDAETVGLLLVSCRTARRPSGEELRVLAEAGASLTERLRGVDRTAHALRTAGLGLLRRMVLTTPQAEDGALHGLRPRERTVLELYADGLSAHDIAELLVISPHTVRTHLKLAYRRLDIHTREEAAELVRRDQLVTLL
jgi:DNA-binding CsgD family transcriptional regulator